MKDRLVRLLQNNSYLDVLDDEHWMSAAEQLIANGVLFDADVAPRAEVERLERILNSYALQYGTVRDKQKVIDEAKSEVAREIFEEIERYIALNSYQGDAFTGRFLSIELEDDIAELKKKYMEENE